MSCQSRRTIGFLPAESMLLMRTLLTGSKGGPSLWPPILVVGFEPPTDHQAPECCFASLSLTVDFLLQIEISCMGTRAFHLHEVNG